MLPYRSSFLDDRMKLYSSSAGWWYVCGKGQSHRLWPRMPGFGPERELSGPEYEA